MSEGDGELDVDVLIVGNGLMAHYLAAQLVGRYTIAVVTDPAVPNESLDSEGYFSAGFDGNDVGRIQPARRATSYWRLWAESNGLELDDHPPGVALPADDVARSIRLWDDAALVYRPSHDWPDVFDDGPLIDSVFYHLDNDVVLDPAAMLDELRRSFRGARVEGHLTKFVMSPGGTVEYVQVERPGDAGLVEIAPRFTVLAAASANATFLNQVATRLRDTARRKRATEISNTCQAVRRQHVIALRGPDLSSLSGHFGGLRFTSHPVPGPLERIWLINPPVDDSRTTVGAEDLRFDLNVDPAIVRSTLEQLFTMSPSVADAAGRLQWGTYVRRLTQHPMVATTDISEVGQPVPAKLESLDIDGFMAVWPSHESYAMVVGDVAAERIRDALGDPETYAGRSVQEVAAADDQLYRARWQRDDFGWSDWEAFAAEYDFKRD